MAFNMIGIGLNDEKDITVKGLEAVKRSSKVFLENYTSILQVPVSKLEEFYGCKIILADRDMVEKNSDLIVSDNNAFLVVGDVFSATTHIDLKNRAVEKGLKVVVVNNASVLNAIGITGLELYKFGKTTSIVFPDDDWLPETPYDAIKMNLSLDLHTLCLLDIKTAEKSKKDIISGKGEAQEARFMTVNEAIEVLLRIEEKRKKGVIKEDMLVVGCARLGAEDYEIVSGKLSEVLKHDFGKPLHCLIVPGKLHFVEEEELERIKI